MRRFILAVAFAGCLCRTFGQTKEINIRRLGVEEGLSHYTVNSICQDEFGFLWIGTMDGLNRYDGRRFEVFRPSGSDSLRDNNIRQVCSDGHGRLYVRGLTGLTEFDLRTRRFRSVKREGVGAMFCDRGRLWVASRTVIFGYDPLTRRLSPLFSFEGSDYPEARISCFGVTRGGDFFVSTRRHGCFRADSTGKIIRHFSSLGEANAIREDSSGAVWVAMRSGGLCRVEPSGVMKRYVRTDDPFSLSHNNVRQIEQVDAHTFVVGTFGGVSLLDTRTDRFLHYRFEEQRLVPNVRSVYSMMRDRQGTLWIGTFNEGLQCYNPEYDIYRYYYPSRIPGRLLSPIVSSVAEDGRGRLWFGTEGGGLNRFDPESGLFRAYRARNGLASDIVKSVCCDSLRGVLWVATFDDGIDRLDPETGRIVHFPPLFEGGNGRKERFQNVLKIEVVGRDSLLLASNRGVLLLDAGRAVCRRLPVGYTAQVWDLLADGDTVWCTTSAGLFRYGLRTGSVRTYPFGELVGDPVNNYLNLVMRDVLGRLWFGSTGSGLFLYDPAEDRFTRYGEECGLGNGYVTGLAQGADGSLLVATNGGLSRFDPQRGLFENYDTQNGFPLITVNEKSLHVTRKGEIFAAGRRCMVSVPDAALRERRRDYRVFIRDVYVNNRRIDPADSTGVLTESTLYQKKIRLRPEHSVVAFEMATNDFLTSSRSPVEYRLEGFDAGFIAAGEYNLATYTNLDPGRYTFVVRGMTPDVSGVCPEASLEVVVLPPFYRSGWFVALCAAVAAGLGFYLAKAYLMRVRLRASLAAEKREKEHIEAVNRSKLTFYTNVSHELRTPLMLIGGQLELLLGRRDLSPSLYAKLLSVDRNARRMNRLVDEVLDIRRQEMGFMKLKVREGDLVPFLREIYEAFGEYAALHGIGYTFRTECDRVALRFDPVQLEKVVYNLLSNAFKYTQDGGRIELSLDADEGEAVIAVTDNGAGIGPEHIGHVFERFYRDEKTNDRMGARGSGVGLALSREIVRMHEGVIGVESEPGVRTRFEVRLPRNAELPDAEEADGDESPFRAPAASGEEFLSPSEAVGDFCERQGADGDGMAAPVTMLVVEDNPEVREMLVRLFGEVYRVHTAPDGEEGIVRARELQPDIVLSDVMMPRLSGTEMCARLKSDPETSHIPVVLLTARSSEDFIVEGFRTGADDYVTKPFSLKVLLARCANLVEGRRRLQQRYRRQPGAASRSLASNDGDRLLLDRAEEILTRYLDRADFDIHTFAREMGLSRTYLFTKIKGITGQTPNEFVTSFRLKCAAVRLTEEPGANLADIAYAVGFSSTSYFIKCFKAQFGRTPNAYRKGLGTN